MTECVLCCILVLVVLIYIYMDVPRRPTKNMFDLLILVAILCQLWNCKKSWDSGGSSLMTNITNLVPGMENNSNTLYHY